MTTVSYDFDVIAWANEQARLLRAGRFSELDVEHIADEIEDVGKSEKREQRKRMAILLSHLLQWQHQPERRGNSWQWAINVQRKDVAYALKETPSLKRDLQDASWWGRVFADAVVGVLKDAPLDDLPTACPWTFEQIIDADFWPD